VKRLLPLCALPLSLAAWSADWTMVPAPRAADLYYYDASKLVFDNEEVTYWKKVLFATPQPFKGQQAASALYREKLHCGQHTVKTLSYLLQGRDGSTLEYTENHDAGATPVIPDSVGDLFEQNLCALVEKHQQEARRKLEAEQQTAKAKAATAAPESATPAAAPARPPTPPAEKAP
jgi:hypothetical protein